MTEAKRIGVGKARLRLRTAKAYVPLENDRITRALEDSLARVVGQHDPGADVEIGTLRLDLGRLDLNDELSLRYRLTTGLEKALSPILKRGDPNGWATASLDQTQAGATSGGSHTDHILSSPPPDFVRDTGPAPPRSHADHDAYLSLVFGLKQNTQPWRSVESLVTDLLTRKDSGAALSRLMRYAPARTRLGTALSRLGDAYSDPGLTLVNLGTSERSDLHTCMSGNSHPDTQPTVQQQDRVSQPRQRNELGQYALDHPMPGAVQKPSDPARGIGAAEQSDGTSHQSNRTKPKDRSLPSAGSSPVMQHKPEPNAATRPPRREPPSGAPNAVPDTSPSWPQPPYADHGGKPLVDSSPGPSEPKTPLGPSARPDKAAQASVTYSAIKDPADHTVQRALLAILLELVKTDTTAGSKEEPQKRLQLADIARSVVDWAARRGDTSRQETTFKHERLDRILDALHQKADARWLSPDTLARHFARPPLISVLQELLDPARRTGDADQQSNRTKKSDITTGTQIAIMGAGLVLVAPFLPQFLQKIGADPRGSVDHAQRAVWALHRLSGADARDETDLVLARILSGLPLDVPLIDETEPDEIEIDTGQSLLSSIRAQWPGLQGSSNATLQTSFLARDGLLERESQGWRLSVTPAGYDVLLDRLSWSYSLVKLHWMNDPVFVTWRA